MLSLSKHKRIKIEKKSYKVFMKFFEICIDDDNLIHISIIFECRCVSSDEREV